MAWGSLFTSVHHLSAQTWTPTSAPTNDWTSVACSADGSKLVAAVNGGGIYTSTNSGITWTLTSAPNTSWTSVASSADGTTLAAVSEDVYGSVYVSTNSGATWNNRNGGIAFPPLPMPEHPCGFAVCLSADGTRLVVAENIYNWWFDDFVYGLIYTSTNSGVAWNRGYASGASAYWSSVAGSANGSKLVATAHGGGIYTSTNSGATWTLTSAPNASWISVASSADGIRLVAASADGMSRVCISTNSGATWNYCVVLWAVPMGYACYWSAVCSSADGTKLAVAANSVYLLGNLFPGPVYTSSDSGTTWNPGPAATWSSVAGSADGSEFVAAANGGGIYTSRNAPAPVLSIAPSGNRLAFSWIVPSTNFVMEQISELGATGWTAVTNVPTINLTNLQSEVTLPLPAGNTFYRLKTP
jgi:photosystem II stability/assembly factor-like uncharacterized protein